MITVRHGKLILGMWGILCGMAAAASAATVTSTTHPAYYQSFDTDAGVFAPYQQPGRAPSGVQLEISHGALQMTNTHAGSFGVSIKTPAFDALQYGDLFFDYKLTPDVKVNFFFHIDGHFYGVIFSGPDAMQPGTVLLGKIPDVHADGKWHRAHIPLRQWLLREKPLASALKVDEMVIGNWSNDGWLMAGIGGNGPGAQWSMDNFTIAATGPAQAQFAITGDDKKPLDLSQKYFWRLDNGPTSPLTAATLELSVKQGFHLLQINDSAQQVVASYGFYAASEPPRIGDLQWHNNQIIASVAAPAGVNGTDVAMEVNGQKIDFKNPALHWNKDATAIVLDADDAGLHWKNGQTVTAQLSGIKDFLRQSAPPLKSTFTVDYQKFTAMPPAPTLKDIALSGAGGFESSLQGWQGAGNNGAILQRDTTTAASGYASLRLTNPANATPFLAVVTRQTFDAANFPFLEFDYRVPPELRVDLLLTVNGKDYNITFTDRTPGNPRLGELKDIKANLQWHHASVPLLAMLQKQLPEVEQYQITMVAFGDTQWLGNTQGTHYWLDNFHFVPALKGDAFNATAQLRDVTGIGALSWKLSAAPETDVPRQTQHPGASFNLTGNGLQWLNLRAQDGAGNWSAPAQIPLALDATSPQLESPGIPSGAPVAPLQLHWPLQDNLGLDLSSLHLTAAGHSFDIHSSALTYNAQKKQLTWDLLEAIRSGEVPPFQNGQKVNWELQAPRDAAGNSGMAQKSTFIFDYARQKSLPEITMESTSHKRLLLNDYNGPAGTWGKARPVRVDTVIRDEKTKDHCLKVANLSKDQTYSAGLVPVHWDPGKYNLFGFDYNIKPGSNAALTFKMKKRMVTLVLCGDKIKGNATIPGIIADGKWHSAVINVLALPGKLFNDTVTDTSIRFDAGNAPAQTELQLDNVQVQNGSSNTVALQWKAVDLSGIAAYRLAWDQHPDTAPTQSVAGAHATLTGKAGVWYAHLQAENNAGLWSKVTHYRILIP